MRQGRVHATRAARRP